MKFIISTVSPRTLRVSHPARGAWIEIQARMESSEYPDRRTPHGVRGLKLAKDFGMHNEPEVAPRTGCVD